TRRPRPHGRTVPLVVSASARCLRSGSEKYRPPRPSVDFPASDPSGLYDNGAGGGMWSNCPSFSSKVSKDTVRLQTSGLDVRASNTCEVNMRQLTPAVLSTSGIVDH